MPKSINFTKFYPLQKILDLKIEGNFNRAWSGKYHQVSRNKETKFEPIIGSGLVVRKTALNKKEFLGDELLNIIACSGMIYTIISNLCYKMYLNNLTLFFFNYTWRHL